MKKLLMSSVIAVSSLFAIAACAQTGATNPNINHPHHNNMQQSNHHQGQMGVGAHNMMSQLNLSAAQRNQMQAIMRNNQTNYTQKRAAMMQILTPAQRQQMSQMRSQHMDQDHHRMNKGHMMNRGQGGHMMNNDHMINNSQRPMQ